MRNPIQNSAGDGELDKIINFADFTLLSNHFGQTGTNWDQGRYNLDTVTNFAYFSELSNRFGMVFTSKQAVP